MALELRRLVHGDLRGMFDGPTTPGLRLDGPLVVLDLSAVYHSPALGVLMACAAAWLQSAVRGPAPQPDPPGGGRGVGHPRQPGRGPVAAVLVEAVAGHRGGQHRRAPPAVGPGIGRGGRQRAGGSGRGAAGRLRDPGGLRPVPRRGGPHRRAPRPHRHRSRPGPHPAAGDGPVEGRPAVVPGRAPPGPGRAVADRHRPGHGRHRRPEPTGEPGRWWRRGRPPPWPSARPAVAVAGLLRPDRHGDRRPSGMRPPGRTAARPGVAAPHSAAAGRPPAGRPVGPVRATSGDLVIRVAGARRRPGRLVLGRVGRRLVAAETRPVGHRLRPHPVPQDDWSRRAGHPRVGGPGGGGQREGRPARAHHRPPRTVGEVQCFDPTGVDRPAGHRLVPAAGVPDLAGSPAGGGHAHRGGPGPGGRR